MEFDVALEDLPNAAAVAERVSQQFALLWLAGEHDRQVLIVAHHVFALFASPGMSIEQAREWFDTALETARGIVADHNRANH
jgi:hypothetical protein